MPLGNRKLPNSEHEQWRKEHGYAAEPTYPDEKQTKGGGAIIVGVAAAGILLALLGIAAASAAKPPTTKKDTSIFNVTSSVTPYDAGYNYSVQGYLRESPLIGGAPIAGRTITLYYFRMMGIQPYRVSIGTGTTDSSGRFSITGFHYIPLALRLEIKFAGDASYNADQYDIEL